MSAQALDIQHENTAPVQSGETSVTNLTPMQMAYQLIQGGADLGSVKEMLAVSKELAADQAKRSFSVAIAAAKAELKPIVKNRDGHNTRYADFAAIAAAVDPIITAHGLSYRFRTTQNDGRNQVTCIIEHVDGHAEENTISAPSDTSGNKNAIQAIGSALTYLQRYSLVQALGIAVAHDDDGKSAVKGPELISKQQFQQINRLLGEAKVDVSEFCKAYKVDCVADLPASFFDEAVKLLKKNIAKAAMDGAAK
ncbi:ERF family protein [Brucella sp. HL-2]|nr:ERF family protein [Brucella sp. HL-2]MCV9909956.1 ERF family protein [Brucella sp. HL-2]